MNPALQKLKGLAKNNSEQKILETIYILMKELGISYWDIVGQEIEEITSIDGKITKKIIKKPAMPLPVFYELCRLMNKEAEHNKKSMRRRR